MRTRHPFIVMILTAVAWPVVLRAAEKFENYAETIPGTLVKFEMVAVPAGTINFAIGNEKPRKVEVKRFWIGKTEVTWNELDVFIYGLDIPERLRMEAMVRGFDAGTRASRSYGDPTWDFGRDGFPALSLTHHHTQNYCEWLTTKTGRRYRLPTEVEWEYACRAGSDEVRVLSRADLDATAWHQENSATDEFPGGKTHPVARKKPNALGIHDMLGNVWEWCSTPDGKAVARGGSWARDPDQVHRRARFTKLAMWAISDPMEPKSRWWLSDGNSVGFRIVREE